jgi:surfactin synthase thioesterase subunit
MSSLADAPTRSLVRSGAGYAHPPATDTARLRLFCFHHAGGAASAFNGWQRALGRDVTVIPVQLPGREARIGEPRHRDMAALVRELAEHLGPLLSGGHAFYGHSMGAFVAYALTRLRLRAGHRPPAALLVGASRAPHLPQPLAAAHDLPDGDLARLLVDLGGVATDLHRHPHWLRAATSLLRDDLTLCASHRHADAEPLPCPIHVFAGDADPLVRIEDATAWARHTRQRCEVHLVPGGHFFTRDSQAAFLSRVSAVLGAL